LRRARNGAEQLGRAVFFKEQCAENIAHLPGTLGAGLGRIDLRDQRVGAFLGPLQFVGFYVVGDFVGEAL
jgi:hypothetical protein